MNQYLVFFSSDKYNSLLIYADSLKAVEAFLSGTEFRSINGTMYSYSEILGKHIPGNVVPDKVPAAWVYFADYCQRTERTEYL